MAVWILRPLGTFEIQMAAINGKIEDCEQSSQAGLFVVVVLINLLFFSQERFCRKLRFKRASFWNSTEWPVCAICTWSYNLFIVVIVMLISLKKTHWQTKFHSLVTVVKVSWQSVKKKVHFLIRWENIGMISEKLYRNTKVLMVYCSLRNEMERNETERN